MAKGGTHPEAKEDSQAEAQGAAYTEPVHQDTWQEFGYNIAVPSLFNNVFMLIVMLKSYILILVESVSIWNLEINPLIRLFMLIVMFYIITSMIRKYMLVTLSMLYWLSWDCCKLFSGNGNIFSTSSIQLVYVIICCCLNFIVHVFTSVGYCTFISDIIFFGSDLFYCSLYMWKLFGLIWIVTYHS